MNDVKLKNFFVCNIVILLLFVIIPVCAENGTLNGFSYTIKDDNTAEITDCDLIGDIEIPGSIAGHTVTSLASELFFGRRNITSVTIPETVTYFGESPDNNLWDYVFSYCYDLERIYVMPGNPVFTSVDGVLYTKDMKNLINYPVAKAGIEYHVPAETDILCCTSFASSKYLRSLYLEGKNTYWMGFTFYDTGDLTVYYHPGGYSESRLQTNIEGGIVHESNPLYCTFQIYVNLDLPKNLETIGNMAFYGLNDSVIRVPGSVKQIGDSAFHYSVVVLCPEGSFAETYCKENGITFRTE